MIQNERTSDQIIYPGWIKKECTHERVTNLFVEKFVALVKDAELRDASYKNDVKVLGSGFWYPSEYFKALLEKKQGKRIEFFKKNNSFFGGYPPKGFERIKEKNFATEYKLCSFLLKKDTAPSLGLENCKNTLCFIDCQTLIEIALAQTCHEAMGTTNFNEYFKAEGKNPLRLDPQIGKTSLGSFVREEALQFIEMVSEMEFFKEEYLETQKLYPELVGLSNQYRHINIEFLKSLCK